MNLAHHLVMKRNEFQTPKNQHKRLHRKKPMKLLEGQPQFSDAVKSGTAAQKQKRRPDAAWDE